MNSTAAHILVVDDEPDLLELLSDALGASGMHVTVAQSGSAAVELARRQRPDFIVTDLQLGDCTGLDVLDRLRNESMEIPAVVITGHGDARALTAASQRRPVELMTKPLNLQHLTQTIHAELDRRRDGVLSNQRAARLRRVARKLNQDRKMQRRQMDGSFADLTASYRELVGQMSLQKLVMAFQADLISARGDDDVFRSMFRMFVAQSGSLFGVAMVCDENAELRIVGRFGVPGPDPLPFCETFSRPIVDSLLASPKCLMLDATDHADMFDESIHRRLVGVNVLAVPLIPCEGEMIGVVILYRKGEQPFLDTDLALADMISTSTALAVRRNE